MGEWHFIPWTIQYLVGGLVALLITTFVFRRDPKALSYKCFFAFGVCLAVWMLSVLISRNAPSLSSSVAFYRIVNFSFLLTQPLLLVTILNIGHRRRIYYLTLIPILPLSLYFLIAAPFDVTWTNFGWAYSIRHQDVVMSLPFMIGYPATIGIILTVLILKSRLSYLRRKYIFILSGFLLYFIPLTVTNMLMWKDPASPSFGGILLTIEFIFIAYAMFLRVSRIEFTTSESLDSLAETWIRFLQRLRDVLPGGELGEDAKKFDDVVQSLGFSDIVNNKSNRQTFDAGQLVLLDMNETMDKVTTFVKKQERALQAPISIEYTDVFTELYKMMRKDSTEFASNWFKTMLRKHGGFLDKQGILSTIPQGTKLPSIFKELQPGKVYLFKEEKPVQAYKRLKEALEYGFIGLCFTKLEPQKVRATYGVAKASLAWLTFQETEMEEVVSPNDLRRLSHIISIRIVDSSRVVFVLDCLDQIIFANSFEEARSLLKELQKLCEENAANLLLSINAEMFKKEQMDAIEEVLSR